MSSPQIPLMDYSTVRQNLKEFLSGQDVFTDYDFDGSAMSILIDLLAHNSYMNGFHANMLQNESYLDTAIVRASVVSRAKALGYTPYSNRSATARIFVTFVPNDTPEYILIPAGSKFTTEIDTRNYYFETDRDQIATYNAASGRYEATLDIYEGVNVFQRFVHNSANPFRFYITDMNVDTTSLIVEVSPDVTSTEKTIYGLSTSLMNLNSDSKVYFLQEDVNGLYEVYFGDGILGRALQNGELIKFSYRVSIGDVVNGATAFQSIGTAGENPQNRELKYKVITLDTITPATSGSLREGISSIKFHAPKSYARQNRVVIDDDYSSFITENFPEIESISVWGGQKNDPPLFGRTYICAKPYDRYFLSDQKKKEIVDLISKYSVLTNEAIIIDPVFTFININTSAYYDPNITSSSFTEIFSSIADGIRKFEKDNVNKFDKGFFKSRLSTDIDASHSSIISNTTTFELEKRLSPTINSTVTYKMNFNTSLTHPYDGYLGCVSSSGFKVSGSDDVFYFEDDGHGNLRSYSMSNAEKIYSKKKFGSVDYSTGTIVLDSPIFTSVVNSSELSIFVNIPTDYYVPNKNEIVLLSNPVVSIINSSTGAVSKNEILHNTLGSSDTLSSGYILSPVML